MLTRDQRQPRQFRIKVWNKLDDTFVADNQIVSDNTANPTTAIAVGSIQIHNG